MDSDRFAQMRRQMAEQFRARSAHSTSRREICGEASGGSTDLYVYDYIDPWGVTAQGFAAALDGVMTPRVRVRINSPGGDVFDGVAIHNLLAASEKEVTVVVDGLAASSASVIAMGAPTRLMALGAQFMVHDPWSFSIGNAAEMRALADLLDAQARNLAVIYSSRTGNGSPDDWREIMTANDGEGTWARVDESITLGLATGLAEGSASDGDGGEGEGGDVAALVGGERSASDERRMRVAAARRALRTMSLGGS